MAFTNRWMSVAAGIVLLAVTLSGAALPHQSEIMRSLNPAAYSRSTGPDQVSLPQAISTIENHHPGETTASATRVNDVIEVRTRQSVYTVDPATGDEIGQVTVDPSWLAALDNLHRCLLSCQGPGHVRWMAQEIPHTRWLPEHGGLTVGGLIVTTSTVVLLVLSTSALRVWWPLQRYRRTSLSTHWRTRRLLRDTDLLKSAGLVLLPLLFLWGYYATALDLQPTRAAPPYASGDQTVVGRPATDQEQDEDIGPRRAVAAAQKARGGEPVALFLPEPGDPASAYTVWLSQGAPAPYGRALGDIAVSVDPSTGRATIPPAPYQNPSARTG